MSASGSIDDRMQGIPAGPIFHCEEILTLSWKRSGRIDVAISLLKARLPRFPALHAGPLAMTKWESTQV